MIGLYSFTVEEECDGAAHLRKPTDGSRLVAETNCDRESVLGELNGARDMTIDYWPETARLVCWFLPPDAVRWRGICYGDVAVCLSVTLMYWVQTTESIIMRPSPDCSPAILVPSMNPIMASNRRRAGKSRKIRLIVIAQFINSIYILSRFYWGKFLNLMDAG